MSRTDVIVNPARGGAMSHGRAEDEGRSIEFPRYTFHDVMGSYVTGGMSPGGALIGGDDGHATAVSGREGGGELNHRNIPLELETGMLRGVSGTDMTGRLEWIRLPLH